MGILIQKLKEGQYRLRLRTAFSKSTKKELEIALEELEKAIAKRKKNK